LSETTADPHSGQHREAPRSGVVTTSGGLDRVVVDLSIEPAVCAADACGKNLGSSAVVDPS
jgi:hypothetical protein